MELLFTKPNDIFTGIIRALFCSNSFVINRDGIKEDLYPNMILRYYGKDIRALSCVNSYLYKYFLNEKRAQDFIFNISRIYNLYYAEIMGAMRLPIFHKIGTKINDLFETVIRPDKEFTDDDLKDLWYLDVMQQISNNWLYDELNKYYETLSLKRDRGFIVVHTLLTIACETKNLNKIKQLLTAGIKGNKYNSRILVEIAKERALGKLEDDKFIIAKLLLKNKIDPNLTFDKCFPTALMIAVYNDDKEYAELLLKYGANPRQKSTSGNDQLKFPFFYQEIKEERDIFDIIGTKKQWFLDMIQQY